MDIGIDATEVTSSSVAQPATNCIVTVVLSGWVNELSLIFKGDNLYVAKHPHKNFYFDVDDTLIMWDIVPTDNHETVNIRFEEHEKSYVVHTKHVEMLKRWSNMGYTIIVWSAAGADWAETVISSLGLKPYVNVCLGKPNIYVDDLNVGGFMPDENRMYEDIE